MEGLVTKPQETQHENHLEHDLLGLTAAMFGIEHKHCPIKIMINFVIPVEVVVSTSGDSTRQINEQQQYFP
jgi:hypothetical protein